MSTQILVSIIIINSNFHWPFQAFADIDTQCRGVVPTTHYNRGWIGVVLPSQLPITPLPMQAAREGAYALSSQSHSQRVIRIAQVCVSTDSLMRALNVQLWSMY